MQIVRTDDEIKATVKDLEAAISARYESFEGLYGFVAVGALLLHDWLTDETVKSSPFKPFAKQQEEHHENTDISVHHC